MTRSSKRDEALARALLTLGALLPYWPLLTFAVVHVTDDGFTSDIWNGELPPRIWAGAYLREHGTLPDWTSQICSGIPLIGLEEPLSLLAFWLLKPAAALDALLLVWILVAAHGTYWLARRMGADRSGAVLGGIAFAVSGYIVCQLKHLGIIGTVVWLPVGLALLDGALSRDAEERGWHGSKLLRLALFGLVFAEQALSTFPQSAYICALTYGAFAIYRVLVNPHGPQQGWVSRLSPLLGAAGVIGLGASVGAVTLLPLHALGALSDRGEGNTFAWANRHAYWLPDFWTFLHPYINGDISDATYQNKTSIFWEDYGYIGLAPFLLALYAVIRDHERAPTRMFAGLALGAYLIVLGPATPVFRVVFEVLPGMSLFRFPTRFLVVVDLALCVLGSVGLTVLANDLRSWLAGEEAGQRAQSVVVAICIATAADLFIHQRRQNPFVEADAWLAPPKTAAWLQANTTDPRIFSPFHTLLHREAFRAAHGWSDLRPFFALREVIQPNSNLTWGLSTSDGYAAIAPSWYVDAWGDHSRPRALMSSVMERDARRGLLLTGPAFATVMRTYGVTHVVSRESIPALEPAAAAFDGDRGNGSTRIYSVLDSRRMRVVEQAASVETNADAMQFMVTPQFDPDRLVLLHDAPSSLVSRSKVHEAEPDSKAEARIEHDRQDEVLIRVEAPRGGFLVLADTYFPGWVAEVDGRPEPIHRANISVRAVQLRPGAREVRFRYHSRAASQGLVVGASALTGLLGLAGLALYRMRREKAAS